MRRSLFGGAGLIALGVIAVLAYLSIFIVDPTQQVLVLRFGQVIRPVSEPGLYYKLPLIDNVVFASGGNQTRTTSGASGMAVSISPGPWCENPL